MSKTTNYNQGGDAQAIKDIADRYYGGYKNMFEAHGWPERSKDILPAVQSRVVETYGTVKRFEVVHQESDEMMFPMEAIKRDPPNVWLTSFYGFEPEDWGFVGFTKESDRRNFLEKSRPGALVAVYGADSEKKDEHRKIIGVLQCSHETGDAVQFMSPTAWREKLQDPEWARKWNHAVKVVRAWRATPETQMDVEDFAPEATKSEAWQHIGARGEQLNQQEALNILRLDLQEVGVFGRNAVLGAICGTAKEVLAPSKAGPVSQNPHVTKESEGPKHLYILRLIGDADAFLGRPANEKHIIKAGFSRSPLTRCKDHNKALPKCAFQWEVLQSGNMSDLAPYPSSAHARTGERAMQEVLCRPPAGESLGGEFFLAEGDLIEEAWREGNQAAEEYEDE